MNVNWGLYFPLKYEEFTRVVGDKFMIQVEGFRSDLFRTPHRPPHLGEAYNNLSSGMHMNAITFLVIYI